MTIGLWERGGAILSWLCERLPEGGLPGQALSIELPPFPPAHAVDLLLLAPGAAIAQDAPLPSCRRLLLPGELAPLAMRCQTPCSMSYGLSERESLSLSASGGAHYALAVQRELLTLSGETVEQQELILPKETAPLRQMALALLLLVLGFAPEALPALFRGEGRSRACQPSSPMLY